MTFPAAATNSLYKVATWVNMMTYLCPLGVPALLAACNAEIRSTLGDKRLQDLLSKIDRAANREQVGCAHSQVAWDGGRPDASHDS